MVSLSLICSCCWVATLDHISVFCTSSPTNTDFGIAVCLRVHSCHPEGLADTFFCESFQCQSCDTRNLAFVDVWVSHNVFFLRFSCNLEMNWPKGLSKALQYICDTFDETLKRWIYFLWQNSDFHEQPDYLWILPPVFQGQGIGLSVLHTGHACQYWCGHFLKCI